MFIVFVVCESRAGPIGAYQTLLFGTCNTNSYFLLHALDIGLLDLNHNGYNTENWITKSSHQVTPLRWSVRRRQSSPRWASGYSEWSTETTLSRQNFACTDCLSCRSRSQSLIQCSTCYREVLSLRTVHAQSSLESPEREQMCSLVKRWQTRPAASRANSTRSARFADALSPVSVPVSRWTPDRDETTTRLWSPVDHLHSELSDALSRVSGRKVHPDFCACDTHIGAVILEDKCDVRIMQVRREYTVSVIFTLCISI